PKFGEPFNTDDAHRPRLIATPLCGADQQYFRTPELLVVQRRQHLQKLLFDRLSGKRAGRIAAGFPPQNCRPGARELSAKLIFAEAGLTGGRNYLRPLAWVAFVQNADQRAIFVDYDGPLADDLTHVFRGIPVGLGFQKEGRHIKLLPTEGPGWN